MKVVKLEMMMVRFKPWPSCSKQQSIKVMEKKRVVQSMISTNPDLTAMATS